MNVCAFLTIIVTKRTVGVDSSIYLITQAQRLNCTRHKCVHHFAIVQALNSSISFIEMGEVSFCLHLSSVETPCEENPPDASFHLWLRLTSTVETSEDMPWMILGLSHISHFTLSLASIFYNVPSSENRRLVKSILNMHIQDDVWSPACFNASSYGFLPLNFFLVEEFLLASRKL